MEAGLHLSPVAAESALKQTIAEYLAAVKRNNGAALRSMFHPDANIAHYYVKGDEVRTIGRDAFVETIASLHARYDNAEEIGKEIEVLLADHIATVRVAFGFVMGSRTLEGQDLFNLAYTEGRWLIIHKSYYL